MTQRFKKPWRLLKEVPLRKSSWEKTAKWLPPTGSFSKIHSVKMENTVTCCHLFVNFQVELFKDHLLSLSNNFVLAAAKFRKIFYRYVDSLSQDDGDEDHSKLLSIERNIFGVIKKDIKDEKGGWEGGDMNKLADQKVAAAIHSSLKSYETHKKHFEPSYFTF